LASHDLVTSQVIHTVFAHHPNMSSYYQMKSGKYRTHNRSLTYPPTYLRRQNGSYYGHQAKRNDERRQEFSGLCTWCRCRCHGISKSEAISSKNSSQLLSKAPKAEFDAVSIPEGSQHPFQTAWEAIRGPYYDAKAEDEKATNDEKGAGSTSSQLQC
jgi:hypothetical protein